MNTTGIIYDDSDGASMRALFGRTAPSTQQFIQNTVANYCQSLGQNMSGIAENVMQRFKDFNSISLTTRIENIRSRMNTLWESDCIKRLITLQQLQQSPETMQRWIMAHPTIRASWNREGCSGFNGNYRDIRPGGVKETHYDYRRVMNGVVEENGSYTNYREPILNINDLLNIFEKNAILQTWKSIDGILEKSNSDITDPWSNGTMV